MIRVKNLSKRYGPFLAVDNISFSIDEGGIVGFLGPNGAGKTTTIRMLTCYLPASSGSASVAGFDVFTQSMEVRQRIGYLPESAPLYPEMRVREYLNFRGKLRGLAPGERRTAIGRAADKCWLTEFIDRPIAHLSKGMRQRVGLADAIMHDPDVLILDEPTVGLDPTQIRETRKLITELGQRHTILLSSHILHEVEAVCNRTIIIAGGRIVASGSPAELRDRFAGDSRVVVELSGPDDAIRRELGAVAGITGVQPMGSANGWNRLALQAGAGRDVREDVFKLAAARGWSLREIRREGATLEDFFIRVTAEQAELRAKAAAGA
jgi:ABC-2 type transport system ATP-binding protein